MYQRLLIYQFLVYKKIEIYYLFIKFKVFIELL